MSELETKIRGNLIKYPLWPAWEIADVLGCSERTVQRVKQKMREEKEVAFCNKINAIHQSYPKEDVINAPPPTKPDMVNSPPHYTIGGIETIDYIKAKLTPEEFRGYLLGNSLKYLSRVGKKGAVREDLGKAAWYVTKLSEVV